MKRRYNYGEEGSDGLTELHSGSAPEAPQIRYKQDFLLMPYEAGIAPPPSSSTWLLIDELPLWGTQELW